MILGGQQWRSPDCHQHVSYSQLQYREFIIFNMIIDLPRSELISNNTSDSMLHVVLVTSIGSLRAFEPRVSNHKFKSIIKH